MRNASQELINELNTAREFRCADVYKLVLSNGDTHYISGCDADVSYNGHVYKHDFLMIKRAGIKLTGEPTVDSLDVVIYADRQHNDNLADKFVMKAAHDGVFDGAYLSLTRVFFSAENAIIGAIALFTGRCEVSSCTGFMCRLVVKSELTGLSALFPQRIFAPQNSYSENDSGQVVTSSSDEYTCCIPLKPSQNVLVRLG